MSFRLSVVFFVMQSAIVLSFFYVKHSYSECSIFIVMQSAIELKIVLKEHSYAE